MGKVCNECGQELPDSAIVCSMCDGTHISNSGASIFAEPAQSYAPPPQQPAPPPTTAYQQPPPPPPPALQHQQPQTNVPYGASHQASAPATAQNAGTVMFCGNCGAKATPGVGFCGNCGTSAGTQNTNTQYRSQQATQYRQPYPAQQNAMAKLGTKKLGLIAGAVVLLIVIAAVFLTSGPLTGTYVYLDDPDHTITFSQFGNGVTLTDRYNSFSGSYRINGDRLIFDFGNDGTSTLTFERRGNTIILDWMEFRKR